jgi:putative addiction module killer protein
MSALQVLEYLDRRGRSPYAAWFDSLSAEAAAKVAAAVYRIAEGNLSGVKGVGSGVLERKIDFGPGEGSTLVILLGGSSKHRQEDAISVAAERWSDYKRRKASR